MQPTNVPKPVMDVTAPKSVQGVPPSPLASLRPSHLARDPSSAHRPVASAAAHQQLTPPAATAEMTTENDLGQALAVRQAPAEAKPPGAQTEAPGAAEQLDSSSPLTTASPVAQSGSPLDLKSAASAADQATNGHNQHHSPANPLPTGAIAGAVFAMLALSGVTILVYLQSS